MRGIRPDRGFALADGEWLRGLSDGVNDTFASISSYPGGGQATGILIPNQSIIEVQVVATAGDSIRLPYASAGTRKLIYNSTATSANMFASAGNNPATGAPDTINGNANNAAYALAGGISVTVFCPRDGIWAVSKSA